LRPVYQGQKSKPADKMATIFREYKNARSLIKRETDTEGCTTQVCELIVETEEQQTQKIHQTPKRSSFTPSVRSSKSLSTAPATAPSTSPSLNSRASTPITDVCESATYMPVLQMPNNVNNNINPLLLSIPDTAPVRDNTIGSSPRKALLLPPVNRTP
jgi:hypothetical protein